MSTELPAGTLELELTEDLFMADPVRARAAIRRLLDAGVSLVVDDYGTGFSSLGYLRDLHDIRGLKLDRSFVGPMTTDPRAAAIVESTINLAHALGMHVVAEGVETDAGPGAARGPGLRAGPGLPLLPGRCPPIRCPWTAGSSPARSVSAAGTAADGSVRPMVRPLGLPFDPIERAGETWEQHFGPASAMRAATSVFRVQQILLARFDEVLKPHELTFARYEVLVLLTFSRSGELPLKVIGSRLMVHPTSVTNAIDRLVAAGYVDRRPNPNDGRGVLAGITAQGRAVVGTATAALTDLDFGLGDLPEADRAQLFDILKRVRLGAGDVADASVDAR